MQKEINPIVVSLRSPCIRRYDLVVRLHVLLIAIAIRCALALGYVIVLIGQTRSGKTLVLNQVLPGRIRDKRQEALKGYSPGLQLSEIPATVFAIDDADCLNPLSLSACLIDLPKRAYLLAFQSTDGLHRMGLNDVLNGRKRVEISLMR